MEKSLDGRPQAVDLLNALLADEFVLTARTRNYHWNVVGPRFHDLHVLFESQYRKLDEFIDELAERARALGGRALGTLGEFRRSARLREEEGSWPDASAMIGRLLHDHEAVSARLREAIERCEDALQDPATANLLADLLQEHEKMAWMLRTLAAAERPPEPGGPVKSVRDVMTRNVRFIAPGASAGDAAREMREFDIGALPVCEGGRVVGMITDRDLTLRVLAQGRDPSSTPVSAVMTSSIVTCAPEDPLEQAEATMRDRQVRRLPVVDEESRLIGLFTIGKVARTEDEHTSSEILRSVTRP